MNEFLNFLTEHWLLSTLFVALLVSYLVFEFKQNADKKEVSADQAIFLYNHQHAVILDIRSTNDFADGHIVGAVHVDASEADHKSKKLQKYEDKTVVIVSADGKQALNFANRLEAQGFEQVFSLAGGIHAWLAAGLPLIKKG